MTKKWILGLVEIVCGKWTFWCKSFVFEKNTNLMIVGLVIVLLSAFLKKTDHWFSLFFLSHLAILVIVLLEWFWITSCSIRNGDH